MVSSPVAESRKTTTTLLDHDAWITVRLLHFREDKSKSWIAEHLGISRNTVAKYLREPDPPRYRIKQPRAKPLADKWRGRVESILKADEHAPRKQKHTAKRIFERLALEEGYEGSQRTMNALVAELRDKPARKACIPLVFQPGKDAQVDFGESYADIAGTRVKLHGFELRLNYSRKKFLMYFPSPNTEAFLEGHVRAFEYLGGVPGRLTYDNLGLAVSHVGKGKDRKLTKKFKELKGYYAFESNFCTPGEEGAHEKGGVEGSIGFSRRNWMVPVPKFNSLEELNAYALAKCEEEDGRTVDGQPEPIGMVWNEEKEHLLPLPQRAFDPGVRRSGIVDRYQTIQLSNNRYSTPASFIGKPLWIKSYWNHIEIGTGVEVVATHPRSYGEEEYILDPMHYLDVLERKPHAVPYARPLLQHKWPDGYWEFYNQMRVRLGPGDAGRGFIAILRCHCKFGAEITSAAINQAASLSLFHSDVVVALVDRSRLDRFLPEELDMTNHAELLHYKVDIPDAARYQVLIEGEGHEQIVA
jgi:transposase